MEARPKTEWSRVLLLIVSCGVFLYAGAVLGNSGSGDTTRLIDVGYAASCALAGIAVVAGLSQHDRIRNVSICFAVLLLPLLFLGQLGCCLG
jgi:hypothetical protein